MRYRTEKTFSDRALSACVEGLSPLSLRGRTGGEGAAGEKNEGPAAVGADSHVASSEGAAPKEPPHAVTRAFPFASSLDVPQRAERPELLGRQRHLATGGEACRQRLVRSPVSASRTAYSLTLVCQP